MFNLLFYSYVISKEAVQPLADFLEIVKGGFIHAEFNDKLRFYLSAYDSVNANFTDFCDLSLLS